MQTHPNQGPQYLNDVWRRYGSFVRPNFQHFTLRTKINMDALEQLCGTATSVTQQQAIMARYGVRFWNHGFVRCPVDPWSLGARDHTHVLLLGNDLAEGAAMLHSAVCMHGWCTQSEFRARFDQVNNWFSAEHGRLPNLGREFFRSVNKCDISNVNAAVNNAAGWWMKPGTNVRLPFPGAKMPTLHTMALHED